MENINLRNAVTRNITYSLVSITKKGELETGYVVYGETTVAREMKKYLKSFTGGELPTITVRVKTEKRVITLEKFLENSIILNNESEEN